MKARSTLGWTALVALLTAILLFPLYWMVVTALVPTAQVLSREPTLVPALSDVSFRAFVVAFTRKPLATWLGNSLLVTLGATTLSLVIAALAGYSLSRFRTRAQEWTGLTLLLTKMLPGSLIVIPFFIMASTFHLIDSLFVLMLANAAVGVPFATWLLKSFFDGIPRELEQAAMIDQARWTVTTGLVSFIGEHAIDWPALMAAGVLTMVPMAVLFVLLEPFLVSGLTAGSQR
jgi:multiple sugar transport system permease protein